mmetsp:Transcript_35698/g.83561  ORF Transcript_35698/g.83561 Transcript_35698/m.83561 type:complete len:185 (-) Transcript_35698:95-649(-)|eukprot:CAMPEP_0178418762 /NCGR_PEP_ID=MMETSP0689_2-20121128/25258_1 /TAXON_ID=160604 /ORGANISM="Amphidinium massartii, Strain CS-259" /LENGTH=184 /DNA_ID=CAMNT_0020040171 /DNA_START=76 /DNA_END=630 /DNA_ORIENTATION=-
MQSLLRVLLAAALVGSVSGALMQPADQCRSMCSEMAPTAQTCANWRCAACEFCDQFKTSAPPTTTTTTAPPTTTTTTTPPTTTTTTTPPPTVPPTTAAPEPPAAGFEACDHQDIFDIVMCESHQCTECTLQYCADECQKTQLKYPTCRCADWAPSRTSYSESFQHQGLFGDVGDFSKPAPPAEE